VPVEEDIDRFKADLQELDAGAMFDRYVAPDVCAAPIDFDAENLRQRIARRFQVPFENVMIVGSAKLGFTLREKVYDEGDRRPAFSPFSDESDVDVAIVSEALFDHIWKLCFQFWHTSGYQATQAAWGRGEDFRNYIFRGWMRPDMLPVETAVGYRRKWFEFFRRLISERAAGDYRVNAGLYRDEYFLRTYQSIALEEAKRRLRLQ
jgi:hypothetical protein